ncbi:insulin receptor substrate 1-like, partial [Psammomys obesus]|uniref:insulin receptor substrate 1-like n=1 Tax=Psammomys obesus TaxID=48139 RepID=UPI002452CED5
QRRWWGGQGRVEKAVGRVEEGRGGGGEGRGCRPYLHRAWGPRVSGSSKLRLSRVLVAGTGDRHPFLPVTCPSSPGFSPQEASASWIFAPFQDVWPVTLRSKGLGRARGLSSGSYRLCLGSGALSLLRKPGSRASRDSRVSPPPALRLSLLSVRRCGHADSFFFLELGRCAPTGPGELWLQAPDAVVAQSIHETVLAAMKRLGSGAA